jgi:hypothetical protein
MESIAILEIHNFSRDAFNYKDIARDLISVVRLCPHAISLTVPFNRGQGGTYIRVSCNFDVSKVATKFHFKNNQNNQR